MTVPCAKPEDPGSVPEACGFSQADEFRQTHRSYLDMLPYLMSGDSDDLDPEFCDGALF